MSQELLPSLGQPVFIAHRLPLQEPMECRNNARRAEIRPNPRAGALVHVFRQQMRRVVRIGFFQELADDGAFEQGFVLVLECWYQTAGVEVDERFWLVVGVDFDVLVRDFLLFQDGPGSLHEGAARAAVSLGLENRCVDNICVDR